MSSRPQPIDPADYWQYRALSADAAREEATLLAVQSRLELARTRRQAAWTALATKYGLAVDQSYSAQDDVCTLTEV